MNCTVLRLRFTSLIVLCFPSIGVLLTCLLTTYNSQADEKKDRLPLTKLLPHLKPLAPKDAIQSFRIEKDFRIELVASEPDVVDPIALAFDADCRLYVAEMRGYPYGMDPQEKPLGRIRLLQDRDGDGHYETSHVFAKQVHWPSGIACWKSGIFVAAPPQILYLKDTNGDGKADIREVVYEGFGTNTAEDIMNNLKWGLDNWIYGAASYNGGEVYPPGEKDKKKVSVRSSSFRFHPVTKQLQRIPGTGDFGNCFDTWGNRFVANAGCLLIHAVFPGTYLDRNPHLTTYQSLYRSASSKKIMAQISPPEPWRVVRKKFWHRWVNTTHDMRASRFSKRELAEKGYVTGGAGCEIYRGSAFPDQYQGDSFTAEPAGNVVVRLKLKSKGVTFEATPKIENREFLASTDNWFRPVNIANGPDGCLYVLDMYREVIEDPSAIPEDILKRIDVTNGRDRGRIYRIAPANFKPPALPKLSPLTSKDLVKLLENPNAWHRETAQRLLVERQDISVVAALPNLIRSTKFPPSKLHALWTLRGLNKLDVDTILAAVTDPHPIIRKHAVRLSERHLQVNSQLHDKVIALAKDQNPQVRFQVAFSLGEGPIDASALNALAEIAVQDANDPWIPYAALSSVPRHSGSLFVKLLQNERFVRSDSSETWLVESAKVTAARKDSSQLLKVLKALSSRSLEKNPKLQQAIIAGIAEIFSRRGQSLSAMFAQGGKDLQRTQEMFANLLTSARQIAGNKKKPPSQRVDSIHLLKQSTFSRETAVLGNLLHAAEPVEIQLAAIQTLSHFRHSQVARILIRHWQNLSPRCRAEAMEALLREPSRHSQLLRAIEKKVVSVADLSSIHRKVLLHSKNKPIRVKAKVLLKKPNSKRGDVLKKYLEALKIKGDSLSGAKIFTKNCSACHRINNIGKHIGPDLLSSKNKTPRELLQAILEPSREVGSQFQTFLVVTRDGRNFSGMIVGESTESLRLRRAEGTEDTILRKDIEELIATGVSLMPDGLEKQINLQQMADLLSFLAEEKHNN